MRVGRMENEEEAEKYIKSRLDEVREILDDIADRTGIVFVCFSSDMAELLGHCGTNLILGLNAIMKVIPQRIDRANDAKRYAKQISQAEEEKDDANQG